MENTSSRQLETFNLQEEKRQYTYQPLPEQHIRLLKVISVGQACEAELENFHMDDLPYFLALSWTWPKVKHKETPSTESLLCNGKHMTIPTFCLQCSIMPFGPVRPVFIQDLG
jgi:hypothetical protein